MGSLDTQALMEIKETGVQLDMKVLQDHQANSSGMARTKDVFLDLSEIEETQEIRERMELMALQVIGVCQDNRVIQGSGDPLAEKDLMVTQALRVNRACLVYLHWTAPLDGMAYRESRERQD